MAAIVNLSTSTFDETVSGDDKPVVVDFWAEWCGPCKAIAPILHELADELGDQVTIAKVNVDDNPELAMRYNVMSIPTLMVFHGGEVHKRLVGAKGKSQLLQELDEFLVSLSLTSGQHGEAIRDLQRRLRVAGFHPVGAQAGSFCTVTEAAVQAFQRHHGLPDTGECDEKTWLALVEASWRLGERSLRLEAPYQRGDDVTALQTSLARLGFDCGRIDGIFGPDTARALTEFQRNCGLDVDGVCGPFTVRALEVNAAHTGTGPGMAALRELVQLGAVAASLAELRVVIGQFGGFSPLTRELGRQLRHHGAKVVVADQPDPSDQAGAANRHDATVYLGFESRIEDVARVAYYATAGFESTGGRALAHHLGAELGRLMPFRAPEVVGRRLPVLRETRMTAVVCSLGPVQRIIDTATAVSDAAVAALAAWTAAPVGSVPA